MVRRGSQSDHTEFKGNHVESESRLFPRSEPVVTWQECRGELRPDGSLRDVYVSGGGAAAWEASLRTLVALGRTRYAVDGRAADLPISAGEALAKRPAQ